MAYATQTDVEGAAGGKEKLVQLTDVKGTGQVDTTSVTAAIAEAQSFVNSYLENRYAVPVDDAEVSEVIRHVVAREAVYILKERREALTGPDQERHAERIRWLEDVRRGNISPGLDPRPQKSGHVVPETGDREGVPYAVTRSSFSGGFT
jgi:phage gp36-like protein